jgi:hypothetical protein
MIFTFFFMAQQPLVGQGLLIIEGSRSHSATSHSVGLLWTSDQPDADISDNTQDSQERDIHVPGGIRPHNPSKRAAADQRFILRGDWDRRYLLIASLNNPQTKKHHLDLPSRFRRRF